MHRLPERYDYSVETDESSLGETAPPSPDLQAHLDQPVARVRTYPVRLPEDELSDFIVEVHASTLKRCRAKLASAIVAGFSLAELLLGIGMLGLGATASAIIGGIAIGSARGIAFYVVVPPLAVGCIVSYAFLRQNVVRNIKPIIDEVIRDLPDPDKTT